MNTAAILLCALMLDAVMGEPKWLWSRIPHPAVLMGRIIGMVDERFNSGDHLRMKGALALVGLVCAAALLGMILAKFGVLVQIVIAAILLAQRSLVQHVGAVATALQQSLPKGRASVAMIVGRDTAQMDESAVARGAIESAAENLSDGVIAPAFWFLVAGLPGLLIYKIVNTADSMIGYRTPRHERFGWASARFDDLLNLVPARLTALLIALPHDVISMWPRIWAEARRHRSPNAGWPEAAMARAIGVALSGPRSYDGELRDFPYVYPTGRRTVSPTDIEAAVRALWITWSIFAALVFALALTGF